MRNQVLLPPFNRQETALLWASAHIVSGISERRLSTCLLYQCCIHCTFLLRTSRIQMVLWDIKNSTRNLNESLFPFTKCSSPNGQLLFPCEKHSNSKNNHAMSKKNPHSQKGKLRLGEDKQSSAFTLYMAEPRSEPALLNAKTQAVSIQYKVWFLPSVP